MAKVKTIREIALSKYRTIPVAGMGDGSLHFVDKQFAIDFAESVLAAYLAQQEAVAHQFQDSNGKWYDFIDQRHYDNTVAAGTWPIRALYLAPPVPAGMVLVSINRVQKLLEYADKEYVPNEIFAQFKATLNAVKESK